MLKYEKNMSTISSEVYDLIRKITELEERVATVEHLSDKKEARIEALESKVTALEGKFVHSNLVSSLQNGSD